jgi:adenine phosphoribosyltransferase
VSPGGNAAAAGEAPGRGVPDAGHAAGSGDTGNARGPRHPVPLGDAEALEDDHLRALIKARVRDIPDYPQAGVVFKDITPLLADGAAFGEVVGALASGHGRVDKVAGIEARGFILAAPVACRLGAGFVPVRKKGKLPAATYTQDYQLEYGTAAVEVHTDAFTPGDRVLIVDDVLATGGTARATADLVRRAGAQVASITVLLELSFLGGRSAVSGLGFRALVTVLSRGRSPEPPGIPLRFPP